MQRNTGARIACRSHNGNCAICCYGCAGISHNRTFGIVAHRGSKFAIKFPVGNFKRENIWDLKIKKAKNSYLINGADKIDGKMKRIFYFTKRQRIKNKWIEMEIR